jgi:hypothetical protein
MKPRGMARPVGRASFLGLVVFLAIFLPLRLSRAAVEQSLWLDETASLMLASHPLSVILDQSAIDTNPPGYFLALKAWLKLGRVFQAEPGILWARSLGTLTWFFSALGLWHLGRSLAPGGATLFLVAIAGRACAAVAAQDARGYCLAIPALALAFLLMLDLSGHPERSPRNRAARWCLLGLLLSVALWSHLLSALVFLLLCILFVILAWRQRSAAFWAGGAIALLLGALSFLPWSLNVLASIGSLKASAVTWMTPATVPNLLSVFYYWYPFGRVGGPGRLSLDVVGAASILLPLAASFAVVRRKRGAGNPLLFFAATAGLGIAVAFVVSLWLLQRFGLLTAFYAPRYPSLTAGLWAAGLAATALWSAERAARGRWLAWLLLAPWILVSIIGQLWAIRTEREGGLRAMRTRFASTLPPTGADLYVMPSELRPFYRATFADFHLRPIEALPCDLADRPRHDMATVLDVNFWHLFDRPRDLIARDLLARGALAARTDSVAFPDWRREHVAYRLEGIDHSAAERLCRQGGLRPAPRPIPPSAVAIALPEDQEFHLGWSFAEVAPDLAIRRWMSRESSDLRFDRALAPGDYMLHLRGYNPAYPCSPAVITVRVPGERAIASCNAAQGELALDVPFALSKRRSPLTVRLTRPTWSPKTATAANDARRLAALFDYAWVEPR